MGIPTFGEPWRTRLQPASYNGAGFFVQTDSKAAGRRTVLHEFPKRDVPYAEDMGRKARRFVVTGYIIQNPNNGFDYTVGRDALIAALETSGPGILIHPTLGVDTVQPGIYNIAERQDRGGMAEFEMEFFEAGQVMFSSPVVDTATTSVNAAQSAITSFQNSGDVTALINAGGTP